ncbi:MAG TPA: hypothetical protein VHD31_03360 [Candidatus Paceibacterota bacterium]|nr:hypothetical protein [Candidatus Paceibacterota bacterium]
MTLKGFMLGAAAAFAVASSAFAADTAHHGTGPPAIVGHALKDILAADIFPAINVDHVISLAIKETKLGSMSVAEVFLSPVGHAPPLIVALETDDGLGMYLEGDNGLDLKKELGLTALS